MKGKTWIKAGAVVLVVGAIAAVTIPRTFANASTPTASYTEINPSELVDSISSKGLVESVTKKNVYTTLGYTIQTVHVEVGDQVTKGQILCELDTENLELDIAQRKAELSVSQRSSLNQLQSNQQIYNEAAGNLKNGLNSQVVNAESSLKTAENNLEKAKKDYQDALDDYENTTNSQVQTAESNLTTAELDLSTKKSAYEDNKALYDVGGVSKEAFEQSEDSYINAQNKYDDAVINLENAKTSVKRTLENAESALKSAETSYENAIEARDSALRTASHDVEKYQKNVESSQISTNVDSALIAIQKLEKQLEDSVIKAPMSGTVTAVYAKEGASGNGMMFVIEDTDNLKITTKIKEYDIAKVKEGMDVTIKSDSTGDSVYSGKVDKIDPTAKKNASGETDQTGDIEFGAEIAIASSENELKVGMETRLTIVLEKKENIYRVPYDAITYNENGDNVIYTVAEDGQNGYVVVEVQVATDMETDFYIEISGDALYDGMKVLNDAAAVHDGMKIALE